MVLGTKHRLSQRSIFTYPSKVWLQELSLWNELASTEIPEAEAVSWLSRRCPWRGPCRPTPLAGKPPLSPRAQDTGQTRCSVPGLGPPLSDKNTWTSCKVVTRCDAVTCKVKACFWFSAMIALRLQEKRYCLQDLGLLSPVPRSRQAARGPGQP